jgi:hypothetical protein
MIAGQPTTLTFSLVAPSGVTYQSPVVTVEENPWSVSSILTDNEDGTYSITITPDRETNTQIRLKAVQDGKTYYHTLNTLVTNDGDMRLKVTNTTNYLPSSGTAYMYFNFMGPTGATKLLDLSSDGTIIDSTSLKVSSNPEVNPGSVARGLNGAYALGYLMTAFSWPTAVDQTTLTWEFDATHPLSGVKRHYSYATPLYKSITGTFVTNETLYIGVEKLIQFTLKFASGKVPSGVQYSIPHTITGGTATNEIITIDAAAGLYGVKVTPTAASMTLTVNYAIGNSFVSYQCGPKAFTAVAVATVTRAIMNGYTRDIGFLLVDSTGPITDATITGITGSKYTRAVSGSYTVSNATTGMYAIPMQATGTEWAGGDAYYDDPLQLTFTRGGKTFTVQVTIRQYFKTFKFVPTAAVYSDNSAITFTVADSSIGSVLGSNFTPMYVIPMNSVTTSTVTGTGSNYISTNGTFVFTPNMAKPGGTNVSLEGDVKLSSGKNGRWFTDNLDIVLVNPSV